jgi:hypothetical protein
MSARIGSTSTKEALADMTARVRPATVRSQAAGKISFAASAASLMLLFALHILSPEFDPSWRMVSEYALGNYGWILMLMFLTWALSCVALFFAIKSQVQTLAGRIGLGFLLLSAIGITMGGLFDVNHDLHGLAAMIGIPSLPIAAILISVSLIRNPSWTPARRVLLATAILTWVSLILMNIAVFTAFSQSSEQISQGGWVGWANRFLIVAYHVWLMVVAWRAADASQSSAS